MLSKLALIGCDVLANSTRLYARAIAVTLGAVALFFLLSYAATFVPRSEIAAQLGLSVHTANQYLTNSAQKLNAVNRMHAVAKALRLGLID